MKTHQNPKTPNKLKMKIVILDMCWIRSLIQCRISTTRQRKCSMIRSDAYREYHTLNLTFDMGSWVAISKFADPQKCCARRTRRKRNSIFPEPIIWIFKALVIIRRDERLVDTWRESDLEKFESKESMKEKRLIVKKVVSSEKLI